MLGLENFVPVLCVLSFDKLHVCEFTTFTQYTVLCISVTHLLQGMEGLPMITEPGVMLMPAAVTVD